MGDLIYDTLCIVVVDELIYIEDRLECNTIVCCGDSACTCFFYHTDHHCYPEGMLLL